MKYVCSLFDVPLKNGRWRGAIYTLPAKLSMPLMYIYGNSIEEMRELKYKTVKFLNAEL